MARGRMDRVKGADSACSIAVQAQILRGQPQEPAYGSCLDKKSDLSTGY